MESISILNFRDMPEISTAVNSTKILTLKESTVFSPSEYSGIFVILMGTATYNLCSNKNSRTGNFSLNHIFILSPEQELTITPSTQSCQILYISFDLFELNRVEIPNDENGTYFKRRKLIMLDECVAISTFEERYPHFQGDVHNLILHCKMSPVDTDVLAYTLNNVLYTMLRVQIHSAISVLKSVHGIVVLNDHATESGTISFSLSDIYIWSDSPKTNPQATVVAKTFSQHIFFERPTVKKQYTIEQFPDNGSSKYGGFCDVRIKNSGKFKIWEFAVGEIPPLDKYVKTGVIKFRFKADYTGSYNLNIYRVPTYKNISYTFEITHKDTWTEFEIPLCKSAEFNVLPPYAEKAVQYIQQNYADKITIQDIADHIRIHPSYLSAIFRKHLNQSVNSYINFHRINVAKQLLRNTDSSITDIALLTGFYDSQHFLKTFKKNTGHTPSEYRNML